MSKTIRQRKDELILKIREATASTDPITVLSAIPTNQALFDEYKKILTQNGIKNEKVIASQLNRLLHLPKPAVYSNLKFMHLFRSRLTEEGIPLVEAEKILEHVRFNMAEINEDDDYIGDVALHFAELCKKYYDVIGTPILSDYHAKLFNVMAVELPPA